MQDSGASIPAGSDRPVINLLAAERVGNGGSSSELEIPILAQDSEGQSISNFHSVYEQVSFRGVTSSYAKLSKVYLLFIIQNDASDPDSSTLSLSAESFRVNLLV
jgi:hypothetical protein